MDGGTDAIQVAATSTVDDPLAEAIERQRRSFAAQQAPTTLRAAFAALGERWEADGLGIDDATAARIERIGLLRKRLGWLRRSAGRSYHRCRLWNFEVGDFPPSVPNAAAATARRRAVRSELIAFGRELPKHLAAGRNLVIFGPSGSGKDHLLYAMARHALAVGTIVHWINGRELFSQFRDAMDRRGVSEIGIVERYARAPLLVVSDPLPANGDALTRYEADMLYRILEERATAGRPTWASLNISDGEDGRRLGVPSWDRLKRGALLLFCYWPSFRQTWKEIT